MTHTEISEKSAIRLQEIEKLSLFDKAKTCLDATFSDLAKPRDLISKLKQESSSEVYYFAESTTSSATDPIKKVEAQIKNGFTTGGVAFDINKIPIWSDFRSETRNIRYKAHSWLMIDSLLVADQIVGHEDYFNKALVIADDWIMRFVIDGESDEFAWYDMAVGQRGTKLAYLLRRLIELNAPEEQIFRFIIAADIHICELIQEDRIATHSNHGLFQMAGLIALVKSLTWIRKSSESFSFAESILEKMFSQHFAEDGLHLEHSPDYHLYMINHLKSFSKSNWLESESLNNMISKVEEAAHWMGNPEKNTIAIGDTANNTKVTRRWGEGNDTIPIGLKTFEKGGLVIENVETESSMSQLVFSAQFHSRQHKHADDLNILYHLEGKPLLVDSGTYTYQYDLPERIYCESTKAHNCVEIDHLNTSRFRKDSYGSALEFSQKIGSISIHSANVLHKRLISSFIPNNKIRNENGIECSISHRRIIIHFPNRFLAIIDSLESENEHEYTQWNHFNPNLDVIEGTLDKLEVIDSRSNIIATISSSDTSGKALKYIIAKGQTQPHLQGWQSHNGRELIPNVALGFKFDNKSECVATVFDFTNGPTGRPYIRKGSSGNYIRFALTQNRSKVDIKIRRTSVSNAKLECVIDGESFEVDSEIYEG